MKLLQILYSGLGGHGSVAFSLSEGAPTDWQHAMIFFGIEPQLPEYANSCETHGFDQTYVPMVQGRSWSSWRALYRAIEKARPDAIVLHSVKTILPCWLYARRHGIPLVAVEHQPNALKKKAEWVVSHLLMRLADAVVVLTPTYRDELRVRLGHAWRQDKVHLIPNGIDTKRFAPTDRQALQTPVRVGMAARFSNRKRQDLLVGAIEHLAREAPDAWHLSLAGDGEELPRIRAMVSQKEVQTSVTLPGYLGEDALCAWFSELDIYVHASDGETLSTSLLQALSCGLPILGSNVEGISNLLARAGGVGLCATSETPEGFAEGLRYLARNRDHAQHLARNARALACAEYSHRRMFERYAALLER